MPGPPSLEAFPRPGLTVDLAILTVTEPTDSPELRLLVQDRSEPLGRALPGAFVRERRTVAQTVTDVLHRKVGVEAADVEPRLLRVFDDPDRDDRTWAVSVAHSLSRPEVDLRGASGELVAATDPGTLLFDHGEIVTAALDAVRERYEIRFRYVDVHPDPDGFLPQPFTLHQLRKVHEAVVGDELHKDNFNNRMKPFLKPLTHKGEVVRAENLRGRPAALYRKAVQR